MCLLYQHDMGALPLSSQAGLLIQWSSPLGVVSGQSLAQSSTLCWLYGDSSAPSCLQPRPLLEHPEAPPTSQILTPTQHQPLTKQRGEVQSLFRFR